MLLDEFACNAVTCSGLVGALGHPPCMLLAQSGVAQLLLDLLLAHQGSVLPCRPEACAAYGSWRYPEESQSKRTRRAVASLPIGVLAEPSAPLQQRV